MREERRDRPGEQEGEAGRDDSAAHEGRRIARLDGTRPLRSESPLRTGCDIGQVALTRRTWTRAVATMSGVT